MYGLAILESGRMRGTGGPFRFVHGATTPSSPQAVVAVLIAVGGVSACAAGGRPPEATEGRTGDAGVASGIPASLPEPGVETRRTADRAGIDVVRYELSIDLRDPASGTFRGDATLHVRLAPGLSVVPLDFAGLDIESIQAGGVDARYERDGPVLRVGPITGTPDTVAIRVRYGGVPLDGLFFGEDRNGDPAIFADNWPNRARWWFPANDHPTDKATVRFEVTAPDGYGVIANGELVRPGEALPGGGSARAWVWESDPAVPIPTYTMVIGVARFEVRDLGPAGCGRAPAAGGSEACAAVAVWALAGDGDYGAERFARAPDMVDFYSETVGPYPYEKLVHVESSTRFGGMENASAIFYGRGGWEGRRMGEGVIAHETAHQWFGDAVTPGSWYHLWVSEGFASYFGPLYFESREGVADFRERMESVRTTAIESDVIGQAIVDSSTNRLFDLLNANHYQKGAWVLHMLRGKLGDEAFFRGIRDYYAGHLHGSAVSDDVRTALERSSGQDLSRFFSQWVYSPGYPMLDVEWWTDGADLVLAVRQEQPETWPTFVFDSEVEIVARDGNVTREAVTVDERMETIRLAGSGAYADELRFDPDGWLLKSVEVRERED